MKYAPQYSPTTPTSQWAHVLQLGKAPNPTHYATTYVGRLYARYVAGELSWREVCQLRDAPMYLP